MAPTRSFRCGDRIFDARITVPGNRNDLIGPGAASHRIPTEAGSNGTLTEFDRQ